MPARQPVWLFCLCHRPRRYLTPSGGRRAGTVNGWMISPPICNTSATSSPDRPAWCGGCRLRPLDSGGHEWCVGNSSDPGFLQPEHDLYVHRAHLVLALPAGIEPKADDVDCCRGQQLQQRFAFNQPVKIAACVMHWSISRPNFAIPCSFSIIQTLSARNPRDVSSRSHAGTRPLRCRASSSAGIRRPLRRSADAAGGPEQGRIQHQRAHENSCADQERGIRTFDPCDEMPIFRRDGDHGTDATIDM